MKIFWEVCLVDKEGSFVGKEGSLVYKCTQSCG
jgi:hypothetical protein